LNTKVWIGSCYFHLGYFDSALKCFTEAVVEKYETLQSLDNDPNSKLYYQLMGDCCLKMENFAAARECFDNPKVVFEIIQSCRESAETSNPIVPTLYSEKCSKSKFQLDCFWWKMSQSLVKETSKPGPGYADVSSGLKCKDAFILLQETGIKTSDLCQKVTDDLLKTMWFITAVLIIANTCYYELQGEDTFIPLSSHLRLSACQTVRFDFETGALSM